MHNHPEVAIMDIEMLDINVHVQLGCTSFDVFFGGLG
jgi:hypothetical protein